MSFELSPSECEEFLSGLYQDLMSRRRRLGARGRVYSGCCGDDAVQKVLQQIIEYLYCGVPLKPFDKGNFPIHTRSDLARYAQRRLRQCYGADRKAGEREPQKAKRCQSEILSHIVVCDGAPSLSIYDERFFKRLFMELEPKKNAWRVAEFLGNCQVKPGTPDIDFCDNKAIADALGLSISEVRTARAQILKVRAKILGDDAK